MQQELIIICGPTASGKTALYEKLDTATPGRYVCINADVGQMYKEVAIGTAKPPITADLRLFDMLSLGERFTAADFRKEVASICKTAWEQGRTPVVVGGSMFYIYSLFFPPKQLENNNHPTENNSEQINPCDMDTPALYAALKNIDPIRAAQIMPNDRYRLVRALNIWNEYKVLPSIVAPEFCPLSTIKLIYVDMPITLLSDRIEKRLQQMLEAGWVDEVARVAQKPQYRDFFATANLIGYREILQWLEVGNKASDSTALLGLQCKLFLATRNYAKKQIKFWKSMQKKIKQHDIKGVVTIELAEEEKFYQNRTSEDCSIGLHFES